MVNLRETILLCSEEFELTPPTCSEEMKGNIMNRFEGFKGNFTFWGNQNWKKFQVLNWQETMRD
jgi:hypothetical protein